jgi:carbohydrate-selective porin OprB
MIARVAAVVCALATAAHADEFATSPARPDYEASDKLLGFAARDAAELHGLVVDATYAVDLFLAPQLRNAATAGGLFTGELDVDLDAFVHRGLGRVHVSSFAIHGKSPTDELMDIHGISGNAAPREARLFEAWYEQPIGPFAIRAGLIAADQEFVYADPADTLLSATFGITTQFTVNITGPVYPVATPGVSARYEQGPYLVQLAVYDGTQANTHGIPTDLGPDTLVLAEATFRRDLGIGAWHHTSRGDGLYATADHQLDERVAAFSRVGYSPDGPVSVYLDAGIRIGPGPLRPEDFYCIGMAFARDEAGDETVIETSYEAQVRWLTIQPDFQMVMMRDRTVEVASVRTTVAF